MRSRSNCITERILVATYRIKPPMKHDSGGTAALPRLVSAAGLQRLGRRLTFSNIKYKQLHCALILWQYHHFKSSPSFYSIKRQMLLLNNYFSVVGKLSRLYFHVSIIETTAALYYRAIFHQNCYLHTASSF